MVFKYFLQYSSRTSPFLRCWELGRSYKPLKEVIFPILTISVAFTTVALARDFLIIPNPFLSVALFLPQSQTSTHNPISDFASYNDLVSATAKLVVRALI